MKNFSDRTLCLVLGCINLVSLPYQLADISYNEILLKKVGFSQKWGWSEPFLGNFLSQIGPAGRVGFYEVGHFLEPPLVFPQIAKMWISGKAKTTKVCFRTFPDLWRHPYTGLFCLILNLTYRTEETFFSRRLSFGSPCQVCPAGWVSKVTKKI